MINIRVVSVLLYKSITLNYAVYIHRILHTAYFQYISTTVKVQGRSDVAFCIILMNEYFRNPIRRDYCTCKPTSAASLLRSSQSEPSRDVYSQSGVSESHQSVTSLDSMLHVFNLHFISQERISREDFKLE